MADWKKCNYRFLMFALCLFAFNTKARADDIYVTPENTSALLRAEAGDTVWLKGGRYSEPIELKGLAGTAEMPVTITAAKGEKVAFDGTDELPDDWKLVKTEFAGG